MDMKIFHFQSFNDAYRKQDTSAFEESLAPFVIKNETGLFLTIKPDDSFQVLLVTILSSFYCASCIVS
jgi:hypothetical protein